MMPKNTIDQLLHSALGYYYKGAEFVASPCTGDMGVTGGTCSPTATKNGSIRTVDTVDAYEDDDDDDDSDLMTFPLAVILHEDLREEADRDVDIDDNQENQYCPAILSLAQMESIRSHLPFSLRDHVWKRIFSIAIHGDSFTSFLQRCQGYKNTVVVMRTEDGHVLGGFASEVWKRNDKRQDYYGSGQSFVFGSHPDDGRVINDNDHDHLTVYRWTGTNYYCQICDPEKRTLCMGGAGDFGWIVTDGFGTGRSGRCGTFGNPPLARPACFGITELEVYGLSVPMFGMF